jgi:hypothetical protein
MHGQSIPYEGRTWLNSATAFHPWIRAVSHANQKQASCFNAAAPFGLMVQRRTLEKQSLHV